MLLSRRRLLISDIEEYLAKYCPKVLELYPRPYIRWVIEDSIRIARELGIDDVQMLRVFVRLRWDVAPGFYKQPEIARVLGDGTHPAARRFDILATEDYSDAWTDAEKYDAPEEWRSGFWVE